MGRVGTTRARSLPSTVRHSGGGVVEDDDNGDDNDDGNGDDGGDDNDDDNDGGDYAIQGGSWGNLPGLGG